MVKIDAAARYSKSLSNSSFDASSVQILLNSEASSTNDNRRKVIIAIGTLIGLLSGVLLITLLVSNSTSIVSTDLQNEVLSKSKKLTLPPTFTARNASIDKQGKQGGSQKLSLLNRI